MVRANSGGAHRVFRQAAQIRLNGSAGSGKRNRQASVFRLMNLDPTVGLDPAVREVTRSRLLAERGMFTMQRLPFLLRLQGELMANELAAQPSVQLAISNSVQLGNSAERISFAAERISQTLNDLPDRLTEERKELLAALEPQEGKLKDLAAEVNRALELRRKDVRFVE